MFYVIYLFSLMFSLCKSWFWLCCRAVLNLFSKNMNTAVENFQVYGKCAEVWVFFLTVAWVFFLMFLLNWLLRTSWSGSFIFLQASYCLVFVTWCLLLQLVLDSHRWVPLPAVGFPSYSIGEEQQEDVTPPSYLMEHPPLAVFINGKFEMHS